MSGQDKKKIDYLKESGNFNQKASDVKDNLFVHNDFFDPHDIMQVKYEMLRKVSRENCSVTKAIHLFGMSRPYYYKLKNAFDDKGMMGLLPGKRGPKEGFKLKGHSVEFIDRRVKEEPTLTNRHIAEEIETRFHITVHPRTIARLCKGQKK